MGPRRMAVDDRFDDGIFWRAVELQWGHGAWPWMTSSLGTTSAADDALQWGHGAWPWMTGKAASFIKSKYPLQWGHGAWPWMTAKSNGKTTDRRVASMGPRRMAVDDH